MRQHFPRLLSSCSRIRPRPVAPCLRAIPAVRLYSTPPPAAFTETPAPLSERVSLFTPEGDPARAKPFYVTTPIFYVNAAPHIGHLHSLLLTDVFARFSRLRHPQRPVVFATGTDEHGMKVQQSAKAKRLDEQAFCDDVSERFRDLAKLADASNTDFIRTTEPRHYKAVEHFWSKLVESGDIYSGTHSGWYSVSDETFYGEALVVKRPEDGKMVSTETGSEVVWEEETNWKFRLSKHKQFLTEWLSKPESVHPRSVQLELLRQVENLEDLSVSRPKSRVKWGIPVPGDPEQTIYVWVDALINYLTVLGYPENSNGWPADVHVVGKDITRFHAIHWPALLHSAGLAPPSRVVSHAHWLMGKAKMSKSRGNVVDPIAAMRDWSVDGVRWYLMRVGGSLAEDCDYSPEQLEIHFNNLADQVGNLLARIFGAKMLDKANRPFDPSVDADADVELDEQLAGLRGVYEKHMDDYMVNHACQAVMDTVATTNRLFTDLKPWAAKDSTKAVTYAYHTLRIASILLQPIMPTKSVEALDRLGVPSDQRSWEDAEWPMPAGEGLSTEEMVGRLREAQAVWKGKGYLFPIPKKDERGLTPP
ncbi:methionine-tRNA ligase [Cryptococcus sp. DSM 104549]